MIIYLAGECYPNVTFKHVEYRFNRLQSFWYSHKSDWGKDHVNKFDRFLLDSGAFTFIMSKSSKGTDIDSFTDQYIDYINHHDIDLFFEMDVDNVFGYDKVKQLRKRIEKGTGKQTIPVYHMSRGKEDFKSMCKDYPYISLGIAGKDVGWGDWKSFLPLVMYAKEQSCKTHGLGITGMRVLERVPFDSVDSSAWTAGNRYKTIFHFDGLRVKSLNKDLTNMKIKDHRELAKHNLEQWIKFANSMESKRLI